MITYTQKSILVSSAVALVNPVNTVGIMGAGLAKEFKKYHHPRMFESYAFACKTDRLRIGRLHVWHYEDWLGKNRMLINFPTKIHWKQLSRLDIIEAGLERFSQECLNYGLGSEIMGNCKHDVSFPMLGCGLGGLDWVDVKSMMEHYLEDLPLKILIHEWVK